MNRAEGKMRRPESYGGVHKAVGSQWGSKIITSNLIPQPSMKKFSVYFFKNKSLQRIQYS